MSIRNHIVLVAVAAVLVLGIGSARAEQPAPSPRPAPHMLVQAAPMVPPLMPPMPAMPPAPPIPPFPALAPMPPMPAMPAMTPAPPMPPAAAIPPLPPVPFDPSEVSDFMQFATPDAFAEFAQPDRGARVSVRPFIYKGGHTISEDQADDLYRQAQDLIDEGRYERAIAQLDRIVKMSSGRVDAALYWKAYSLAKLGQRDDALTTLLDMEKRFADSRWLKDAKTLEIEIRQASGQTVSPDAQIDEDMKLLALHHLMQNDPDRAVPAVEKILSGNSSMKVKSNALFVLSQSRLPRAREVLASVAKNGSNPDLQLRAIRYVGAMGAADNQQVLDEAYRASTDTAVKRAILRSFMTSGNKARLLAVAKTETSPELRGEAVRLLGAMHASAELAELYRSEQSPDVKKKILQAVANGQPEVLIEFAKNEKDPTLRTIAVRQLASSRQSETGAALASIYASDSNPDVRKAIINALAAQQNAKALIDLARAEKNPEMKKEIVSKLSVMKSKEATDYLLELLK